jgi:hypothetical protein
MLKEQEKLNISENTRRDSQMKCRAKQKQEETESD